MARRKTKKSGGRKSGGHNKGYTFAKRTLYGYWTGKHRTIEQLSGLMGNSRDVAWKTCVIGNR